MSTMFAEPERNPICIGCLKPPEEIQEFITLGAEEGLTPAQYVREHEATYNSSNGHFACSVCFEGMGRPSSTVGWIVD